MGGELITPPRGPRRPLNIDDSSTAQQGLYTHTTYCIYNTYIIYSSVLRLMQCIVVKLYRLGEYKCHSIDVLLYTVVDYT